MGGHCGAGDDDLVVHVAVLHLGGEVSSEVERGMARVIAGAHDKITGLEMCDKVIEIDQSPIGRTPRSNPATYTGAFQPIRDWFAGLPESKARGYGPGRFSFNVKGGRCEACQGDGLIKIEMHFLPDVYVTCDVCKGKRYNRETLEILFKGKSIADILDMTVEESADFFKAVPPIRDKMETLKRVGLTYIKVGQQATTLSGGEVDTTLPGYPVSLGRLHPSTQTLRQIAAIFAIGRRLAKSDSSPWIRFVGAAGAAMINTEMPKATSEVWTNIPLMAPAAQASPWARP